MSSIAEYFPGIKERLVTFDGIDIADLGDILDANGRAILEFNAEASAVNYVRISNAATGQFPEISGEGSDGSVGLNIATKGGSTINLDSAATTSVGINIYGDTLTSGTALDISDLDAITTGKALHIDATGITHTSGILVHIDSAGTVITGAGRLFLSDHTGVTTTSGILNEFKTIANDETILAKLTAASLTTGTGLAVTGFDALTSGIATSITSAATAITGTGRLLSVSHSGATTTSGIIAEAASAATDETVVFQASASGALALGKVLNVSGAAVTTGTLLSVADADALTTGTIAQFKSNSASTGTRVLVDIHNDNSLATGTTPLRITQDNVTSTNFKLLITLGTISIYTSNETSPNTALTATKGSLCLNGSVTGQAFWNTDGATAWTALA